MAEKNNKGKNAGATENTGAAAANSTTENSAAANGTTEISAAAANGTTENSAAANGTTAGPKKSSLLSQALPTASTDRKAGKTAVSPVALTGLTKGSSLAGLRIPGLQGQPKGSGGRTANGEKPKQLAVFGAPYAKYNELGKLIANGQIQQIFATDAEGKELARTKENRIMIITDGTSVLDTAQWSLIPESLVANGIIEDATTIVVGENGAWVLPAGYYLIPQYNVVDKTDALSSFRRYGELAPYYTQLAANEKDEATKADYTALAKMFTDGNDYQGFACSSPENAQKLADRVRGFFAINPEWTMSDYFTEMETWEPVFGQKDVACIVNTAYVAQAPAAPAPAEA